ncbi:hypothetical protein ACFY8B_16015 [Streptomyces sp. NPDC012751]|uniref:hypothetical protein n=1 Tax=Streptomyces sp. NPDC012751 TaxID=3364846 RepID=UPI0036873328
MAVLPEPIRLEIFAELARHFDAARWEEVSPPAATEMYDRFARDPKIGGRLAQFMPTEKIRPWIKDGPAKQYRRALEGLGPMAQMTSREYPGPRSVVRLALGAGWTPRAETLDVKPMRCFADGPDGEAAFVTWGPMSSLQGMVWHACLRRAESESHLITIAVTKPNTAPLPDDDWQLAVSLASILRARCEQVTYAVSRKATTGLRTV